LQNPFEAPIYYIPSVDSTMNASRSKLGNSPAHGTVLIAGSQTSGRGRVDGREWLTAQDEGLLSTIVISRSYLKVPVTSVPIRIALAVCRMLKQQFQLKPKIKWPNDVLVKGKKICGVLCESTAEYVYAGVGLNVVQNSFPEQLKRPATSIFLESSEKVRPVELLPLLLSELQLILPVVQLPILVRPWLYRLDDEVSVIEGSPKEGVSVHGIVTGIGESGELRLLQKSGKIRALYSGE